MPRAVLIDRDPQNLPVPLGGMAPVRVRPHRRRAIPINLARVLAGVAAASGTIGLGLLLVPPPPVAVSLFGDRLEVGDMVLRHVTAGAGARVLRYEGDASYALDEHPDGTARAAAAWASAGAVSSGVCTLRAQGARWVEECSFAGGDAHLTAVDVLDPSQGSAWQRTYSDGVHVTIAVAADGGIAPVPFPIGR